jgi:hypothetical protein
MAYHRDQRCNYPYFHLQWFQHRRGTFEKDKYKLYEGQDFTISIGEPITPKGIFMLPTLRVP